MKKFTFLKITPILILFHFISFAQSIEITNTNEIQNISFKEEARMAFDSNWDLIRKSNLSDSLTFNKFMSFFADDFLTFGNEGSIPDDMKGTFNWLQNYIKTHKANIDITIDKVDASQDFAYILFRYREYFNEIESKNITIDVMHSSIMILRKNKLGEWKCVLWKFT